MRFLHAADIHIDSPLRGLSRYEGAPAARIRSATRLAFENLVQLAIDESVDFVVLAGDLFDGQWPDMQTGLWTARQFRRLQEVSIPIYLLRGNHDAASVIQHDLRWPDNVHCFPDDSPHTFELSRLQVALHGQGFAERETREDLVHQYPAPIEGAFNIGVLHTSLSGTADHDVYAPTHEEILVGKRYDYWALGHIHQRRVVRETPHIVYSGNTQGRHIRETGPKGCYLVEVMDRRVIQLQFVPTDAIRWLLLNVDLEEDMDTSSIVDCIREALADARVSFEGRFHAVRIVVRGRSAVHEELADSGVRGELVQRVRYELGAWDDELWVEKILFETEPRVDLQQLRESAGPLGDLLREIARLERDPDRLASLTELFHALERKAATELHEAQVSCKDPATLRRWLHDAERILATLESSK